MSPTPTAAARQDREAAEELRFFRTPADLRRWLAKHHDTAAVRWVGYYKKDSGEPSVTWPESVDEALCVGWIDGVRKSIDAARYKIRFSPRRRGSIWSAVNIARVAALTKERRMRPAGLAAFEARRENRSGIYSYEQRPAELPEPYAGQLRAHEGARAFFAAQSPSYRRLASWYVLSVKKEATRAARMATLLDRCAAGKRL